MRATISHKTHVSSINVILWGTTLGFQRATSNIISRLRVGTADVTRFCVAFHENGVKLGLITQRRFNKCAVVGADLAV